MTEANSKLPNLTTKTEDFISMLENKDAKPLYKMTPEQARQFLDNLQKETHKDILADVKDTQIFTENKNSIALRIIRPANNNEKLPAIIYLHGGGWVMGGKESFDMLIKQLAINTNSVVIFPEYSRSPEAKYPVALKEIYSVHEYIYENPDEFNIDNDSIAIAGDSAEPTWQQLLR